MKTQIHSNQFIVASVSKIGGVFSISEKPLIHAEYATALHEAQRLASIHQSKKFIVLAVAAVADMRPVDVPVVTSYRL